MKESGDRASYGGGDRERRRDGGASPARAVDPGIGEPETSEDAAQLEREDPRDAAALERARHSFVTDAEAAALSPRSDFVRALSDEAEGLGKAVDDAIEATVSELGRAMDDAIEATKDIRVEIDAARADDPRATAFLGALF